jgi:hypothetical protein
MWDIGKGKGSLKTSFGEQFSAVRTMVYKRGALMRATWTKGRLWALVRVYLPLP